MRSTKSMRKKDSFSERRPGGGATAGAVSACRHILHDMLTKKIVRSCPTTGGALGGKGGCGVMHTTPLHVDDCLTKPRGP